jgi:choline/glycine/proline betaine transport protein
MPKSGETEDPQPGGDGQSLTVVEAAYEEFEEAERRARHDAIYNRSRFRGLQVDTHVDFYPEVAGRKPGETNIVTRGFDLHPQVTFWSSGLLIVFMVFTLVFSHTAEEIFESALDGINHNLSWFYIIAGNVFVLAVVFFAASRYGKIRIGGPDARPEFSTSAWYAMLLSAGMGIGLMFWSVGEPISHNSDPAPFFGLPDDAINTGSSAQAAMVSTFFHWGVHPWAIYALVAMALSFFAYNRGLPLTFRSVFYPVLGPRIYGGWGHVIDVLTVLATLFGLATSLGLGVGQVAAGLNYLFDVPDTTVVQVALISGITALATLSVVAGLDAGVKRLSQVNIGLAALLLVFMIIVGPTLFVLSLFTSSTGDYLGTLPELAFWNEGFTSGEWQGTWTVFYWGWWISWSPFVGMFIARISKGRTIREMALGVILFPSILSFFWMSVFGGSALRLQLDETRDMATAVNENVATAMFEMFEGYPLTALVSGIAILLVVSFFVTSSDSGSLVIDHLTSGGKLDSPRPQRVFWAVMEGLLAAVLLIGGGLAALQTASVASGLLFGIILLIMIWSLRKAFHQELELLEGHYDAVIFRERHAGLLERALDRGKGSLRVATGRRRATLPSELTAPESSARQLPGVGEEEPATNEVTEER